MYVRRAYKGSETCCIDNTQTADKRTALHYAAWNGRHPIIFYLLTDLSQQQKYNSLQLQDKDGCTPLHYAASQQKPEVVHAILACLFPQHQIQLLNIKNKKGQAVTDIRPELYKEHPLMLCKGIGILHVLQLKYFQVPGCGQKNSHVYNLTFL